MLLCNLDLQCNDSIGLLVALMVGGCMDRMASVYVFPMRLRLGVGKGTRPQQTDRHIDGGRLMDGGWTDMNGD